MNRREFVAGSAWAAAGPLLASAQDSHPTRRIGVLLGSAAGVNEAELSERMTAFQRGMQETGWTEGQNLQIEFRRGAGNLAGIRHDAAELAALSPDVIFTSGTVALPLLLEATRTVPIVFANVADPVGAGFVDSLARPGGNATGFVQFEYSLSGKWLELLKEVAPRVTRVGVFRDPGLGSGTSQFAVI